MNNFLVYILPGAFGFFMMAVARALFEEIPASLEESAKMDGAGYLRSSSGSSFRCPRRSWRPS